MNSRVLDIAAFLAALCIVIAIASILNHPGTDASTDAGNVTGSGAVTTLPTALPEISLPAYLTKDERNWLISRQVSDGMDYFLPATRNYAAGYISDENSGIYSIGQACDVWDRSVEEWTFDPQSGGILDISPASRSISTGLTGGNADFAVFVASMIKGIGGEARIKDAVDPDSGEYAYAELYLGNSDDYEEKIINPEKYSQFKANYSAIFAWDPSGLSIFRYRYGRLCSGNDCYDFSEPFLEIMNEPEKYGEICYNYPKLIDYLLLFPDTNAIDFQTLYIKLRYGKYDDKYHETRDISGLEYNYNFEDNGETTYWLPLTLTGRYPGDTPYKNAGSATVFYSDGSYESVRVNEKVARSI